MLSNSRLLNTPELVNLSFSSSLAVAAISGLKVFSSANCSLDLGEALFDSSSPSSSNTRDFVASPIPSSAPIDLLTSVTWRSLASCLSPERVSLALVSTGSRPLPAIPDLRDAVSLLRCGRRFSCAGVVVPSSLEGYAPALVSTCSPKKLRSGAALSVLRSDSSRNILLCPASRELCSSSMLLSK